MAHIPIDKPPVIFDDPDFCNDQNEKCKYLSFGANDNECKEFSKYSLRIKHGETVLVFKKCDECKEAWKKAKMVVK